MMSELARLELRVSVNPDRGPLVDGGEGHMAVLVVDSPESWVELVLPVERARQWAAELFCALSVAYHDLTDESVDVWPLTPAELLGWADGIHDSSDEPLY